MIGFGMKNTLVTFIDKYYEYDCDINGEKRGLTIGGYECFCRLSFSLSIKSFTSADKSSFFKYISCP